MAEIPKLACSWPEQMAQPERSQTGRLDAEQSAKHAGAFGA
jgi:hypothetical protein